MPAVTNGAELVRRLKESGTGASKLEPARKFLQSEYERRQRVPSATEVISAMEVAGVPESTIEKARHIAEMGHPPKVEQAGKPKGIEDVLAPPVGTEPEAEMANATATGATTATLPSGQPSTEAKPADPPRKR